MLSGCDNDDNNNNMASIQLTHWTSLVIEFDRIESSDIILTSALSAFCLLDVNLASALANVLWLPTLMCLHVCVCVCAFRFIPFAWPIVHYNGEWLCGVCTNILGCHFTINSHFTIIIAAVESIVNGIYSLFLWVKALCVLFMVLFVSEQIITTTITTDERKKKLIKSNSHIK